MSEVRAIEERDLEPSSRFTVVSPVLCVDFDGTLTPTDSLYECLILALRLRPWIVFLIPFWLVTGRAGVKEQLIAIAGPQLRADLFPRNQDVVDLIAAARAQGRRVELVSAAHADLLQRCGDNPSFEATFGSRDGVNLKGAVKAKFLAARHPEGFAYVGDSAADVHVWQVANERFGVGLSSAIRRRLARHDLYVVEISPRRSWVPALVKEMRPHQWVKNLLVFVSLGLALQNVNSVVIVRFVTTFVAFCLLTSGTYIVNDLTDLAADREHRRKRFRPIASGALPIVVAMPAAVILVLGGLALAFSAGLHIGASLVVYLGVTLLYSFGLKRLAIVDVLTVAILFTTRIVAGAFGYPGPVSRWIIVFSIFFFTSLALIKRTVETGAAGANTGSGITGRGYRAGDHVYLLTMGIGFGVGAVIVFSLYVSDMVSGRQQYHSPDTLWIATGVLGYWMMRMWLQTVRGEMHDDPILHAVRDPVSIGLGVVIFFIAVLAQIL